MGAAKQAATCCKAWKFSTVQLSRDTSNRRLPSTAANCKTAAAGAQPSGCMQAAGGCFACLVDDAVEVDGGCALHVDGDDVGAGLGKVCHALLRLHNHQVAVQGLVGDVAQGVHNQGADGDVGHKAAVHDVHVDPVGAGLVHGGHLGGGKEEEGVGRASNSAAGRATRQGGGRGGRVCSAASMRQCACPGPDRPPPRTPVSFWDVDALSGARQGLQGPPGCPSNPTSAPTCSPSLAKLALRMLGATMMSLLLKESTAMRDACTCTVLLRATARRAGAAVKAVDRAEAMVCRCVRVGGGGCATEEGDTRRGSILLSPAWAACSSMWSG